MSWKIVSVILALFCLVASVFFMVLQRNNDTAVFRNPLVKTSNHEESITVVSPPLLATVFHDDHRWVATLPAERKRVLIATGDIIPARSVNAQTVQRNDFTWAFQKTVEQVSDADITFINLETPLLRNCPVTHEGMVFCGDARHVQGLMFIGTDVVSIANNHAGNHGIDGIAETVSLLRQNNMLVTGMSGPVYKTVRGMTFAFLGYNDIGSQEQGLSWGEKDKIREEIRQARKHADIVIATYHWGAEYRAQPDERQKELGRFAIDAGADLIIGNHPHWIQPIEIYKGKVITYAHGNYIFDQMWSKETQEGVIGRYTFFDNQLVDIEYLPLRIVDYGQAYFLEGEEKRQILDALYRESMILAAE